MSEAWKCCVCHRTFKGSGVHQHGNAEAEPVRHYCDNCWAKRAIIGTQDRQKET